MNQMRAIEEMIETIQEFDQCTIYLEETEDNEDTEICICSATDYVGGEEGYYMCDVLGNVQYDDIEEICQDVIEHIQDRVVISIEVD